MGGFEAGYFEIEAVGEKLGERRIGAYGEQTVRQSKVQSPKSKVSPLTPALSPSAGERGNRRQSLHSLRFSLSPAEGGRAGVRGPDGGTPDC